MVFDMNKKEYKNCLKTINDNLIHLDSMWNYYHTVALNTKGDIRNRAEQVTDSIKLLQEKLMSLELSILELRCTSEKESVQNYE